MEAIELKLKQASAVLGVSPKDLQNLVQFKVLRPTRRDSLYWFDNRLLLEAKVALYLKESLGTSTEVLALFARAPSGLKDEEVARLRYVSLRSLPTRGTTDRGSCSSSSFASSREPIEIRVPLPRGRKSRSSTPVPEFRGDSAPVAEWIQASLV